MPGRLAVAAGLYPVDAGEGESSAYELSDGATFAEKDNAQDGGGDGQEITKGHELGDFQVAQEPKIKQIGEDGTEKRHVEQADPSSGGNGAPVGERSDGASTVNGDRQHK